MRRPAASALLAAALAAGCSGGGSHHSAAPPATTPAGTRTTPAASATGPAPVVHDRTVWLCRPGTTPNPCGSDLTATDVLADGSQRREPAPLRRQRDLDCFYVYPTVSREPTANADLRVQRPEVSVAVAQAARFSSACRVWAPMYRQRTVGDLFNLPHGVPESPQNRLALASLQAAWRDYLAHDNGGRRVVLIGHSQGAAMLIRLIRADIDPHPAVRRRVALAILLGGNVTVAPGRRSGGSFSHVPLCARPRQAGCVIAYSSFPAQPPAFSFFGRAGAGVSALAGETASDRQVACVNPAAIGGGSGLLHPYFPSAQMPTGATSTPWTAQPGRYRARCRHAGSATWLEVTPTGGAADRRPKVRATLGAEWGFHVYDVNLALGDLVADVAALPSR